jgi:hypothetical protein
VFFWGKESYVGGRVGEDEEDAKTEDDGYGAFDEEDKWLEEVSDLVLIEINTKLTQPLYPPYSIFPRPVASSPPKAPLKGAAQ